MDRAIALLAAIGITTVLVSASSPAVARPPAHQASTIGTR